MADKTGLQKITDKFVDYYKTLGHSDVEAGQKAKAMQVKLDALLKKPFDFGLDRQKEVRELLDNLRSESTELVDTKKSGPANKLLDELQAVCLRYAQEELLKKVTSLQLTGRHMADEKDKLVLDSMDEANISKLGSSVFKPGETRTLESVGGRKLISVTLGKDGKLSVHLPGYEEGGLTSLLNKGRVRDALISATVATFSEGYKKGNSVQITDGTVDDAKYIIGGLIKAGVQSKIEPLDVNEWSKPVSTDQRGMKSGHDNSAFKSQAAIKQELETLNKKIAEHNRLLDPTATKKEDGSPAVIKMK